MKTKYIIIGFILVAIVGFVVYKRFIKKPPAKPEIKPPVVKIKPKREIPEPATSFEVDRRKFEI